MYDARVTFQLTQHDADALQRLAERHDQSLSQLLRDAVALLLSDMSRYYSLLTDRLLQHAKPPTPEQQANFDAYMRTYQAPDFDALLATMPQPPDNHARP
jgi:hypothetical protein